MDARSTARAWHKYRDLALRLRALHPARLLHAAPAPADAVAGAAACDALSALSRPPLRRLAVHTEGAITFVGLSGTGHGSPHAAPWELYATLPSSVGADAVLESCIALVRDLQANDAAHFVTSASRR